MVAGLKVLCLPRSVPLALSYRWPFADYERLLPSERVISLLSSSSLDFRTDSSAACSSRRFTPMYFLQCGQDNFGSYFRREIISSNFTEQ
jgi:hypothetical protein